MRSDSDSIPSGDDVCEHLPGPALIEFELSRENLPQPDSIVNRLFESSRARWRLLEAGTGNRVLWRQEALDRFRYSIAMADKNVTSAIDVWRPTASTMRSHAHLQGVRRLDCAIHRYEVSPATGNATLRERIELRSTSRIFRLYRHRVGRDVARAANDQLDELVWSLRAG
jgi:hypothetical protein